MLKTCEEYAETHNLKFSTDPIPRLSKTRCQSVPGLAPEGEKPQEEDEALR